ncbi:MAG: YmdB family metallophosphoesterase, partial [candidate division NC10 bacterium]|nr:YmdB family metallophosphoesterase [candidate division NC10 bacterium]
YVTDVGMTGSAESVIGIIKEDAIARFLTQMPQKYKVAKGSPMFNAVMVEIEPGGQARQIIRVNR